MRPEIEEQGRKTGKQIDTQTEKLRGRQNDGHLSGTINDRNAQTEIPQVLSHGNGNGMVMKNSYSSLLPCPCENTLRKLLQ